MTNTPTPLMFPPDYFRRQDESDDFHFYTTARKVVHIDDAAIATLTDFLRETLPAGGALLDLMSSWRSHLPPEMSFSRVVGLGMNGEEMADNPQLSEHVVHSLNANPFLPFDDDSFDAAVCTVSVQYLVNPLAVFAEVGRVLKPGAPFVVSFSNRCFPTKAVAIWRATDDQQHMELVAQYFAQAGGWTNIRAQYKAGRRSFFGGGSDPLYVVWGERAAREHTE